MDLPLSVNIMFSSAWATKVIVNEKTVKTAVLSIDITASGMTTIVVLDCDV